MKIFLKLEGLLSITFVVLFIFSFDEYRIAMMTIIAAVIHELGHIFAMVYICKMKFAMPRGSLDGFRIYAKGNMSYKQEMIIIIAGPLANLISSVFFFAISSFYGEFFLEFATVNILTMASNLMPIEKYDGYKFLSCILSLLLKSYHTSQFFLDTLSFSFSAILCFFSLYLILKIGTGYLLFAVLIINLLKFISQRLKRLKNEKNTVL